MTSQIETPVFPLADGKFLTFVSTHNVSVIVENGPITENQAMAYKASQELLESVAKTLGKPYPEMLEKMRQQEVNPSIDVYIFGIPTPFKVLLSKEEFLKRLMLLEQLKAREVFQACSPPSAEPSPVETKE